MCARDFCTAKKPYTSTKLLKKKEKIAPRAAEIFFFPVLMQEGINIPRCLCNFFNYLHLITSTNQVCVFICCLREKALHGVAGGN